MKSCEKDLQTKFVLMKVHLTNVIKLEKMGKMCRIFNLCQSFIAIQYFLTENITAYNFCILNKSRFKRDCEKNVNKIIVKVTGYAV